MKGIVYYLCYSDSPDKTGLVFPEELNPNHYSPGIWTIAINAHEAIPESFEFDAVNINQITTSKLVRVNRSVYKVDIEKFGKFFFRINRIFNQNYVGNSRLIEESDRLYQLTSLDIQKLEQTCENGFYFVGRTDKDVKQR